MASKELCSPLYRCFPPQPTICFICKKENADECLFRKTEDAKK
jgi:hypothetical protein